MVKEMLEIECKIVVCIVKSISDKVSEFSCMNLVYKDNVEELESKVATLEIDLVIK